MVVNPEAKTYWDNIDSAINELIYSGLWTTEQLEKLLEKLPRNIPTHAFLCVPPTTEKEQNRFGYMWHEFVCCVRAVSFMVNGSSYISRDSMELRCKSCRRYALCPTRINKNKIKFCINTLKLLGADWRAIVG